MLKRAQDRVVAARPYAEALKETIADLVTPDLASSFPLLRRPEPPAKGGPTRAAVIVLTSKRGQAGAFNSNLFSWAITFFALDLASRPDATFQGATMVGIIGAVFILPYLLFSDYAGQLADRHSKRSVLIAVKSFEIVVMASALGAEGDGR